MTVEQITGFLNSFPLIPTGIVGAGIVVGTALILFWKIGQGRTFLLCWGSLIAYIVITELWKSPPAWTEVGLYLFWFVSSLMAFATIGATAILWGVGQAEIAADPRKRYDDAYETLMMEEKEKKDDKRLISASLSALFVMVVVFLGFYGLWVIFH